MIFAAERPKKAVPQAMTTEFDNPKFHFERTCKKRRANPIDRGGTPLNKMLTLESIL
jgi:hypothetical protein